MLKALMPAILSTTFVLPVADGPPTLAVERGCRESARADPMMQITVETCLKQEHAAREQVKNSWSTFSAGDRAHCQRLISIGMPGYVELLTCLEMSRDARQLRQQQPAATQGRGAVRDISR